MSHQSVIDFEVCIKRIDSIIMTLKKLPIAFAYVLYTEILTAPSARASSSFSSRLIGSATNLSSGVSLLNVFDSSTPNKSHKGFIFQKLLDPD